MSTNIQKSQQDLALEMAQGQSSDFHTEWVLQALRKNKISNEDWILDFGAGRGNFLLRLQQDGFKNLRGADLLPAPKKFNGKWYQENLNHFSIPDLSHQQDVIVAIEVIEHLENPRQMFRDFYAMLKPGGVIVTTPNVESFRSLISLFVRGHYVDFLESSYPAHLTPVLSQDLMRASQEAGFVDLEIQFSGRGSLPFFTGIKWQQLSMGLLHGRRTSDHIMIIGRKPL